jgi:hypothetical protein
VQELLKNLPSLHQNATGPRSSINQAHAARDSLTLRHYVVTGSLPEYFTQFTERKLLKLRRATGEALCLVVIGDIEEEDDFYVIPWSKVCKGFTQELLHKTRRPSGHTVKRWVCHIRNGTLQISKRGVTSFEADVRAFRGDLSRISENM